MHKITVHIMVFVAGLAALSWEAIWQIKTSLAIGISTIGTAVTLVATMGGMTVGSLLMGYWLKGRSPKNPLRLYGLMELCIGLSGLLLHPGYSLVETLDRSVYGTTPWLAPVVHLLGILLVLGLPTMAMGATIPLLGLVAARVRSSIGILYALNTAGASLGILILSFLVLPELGIRLTCAAVACFNIALALVAWFLTLPDRVEEASSQEGLDEKGSSSISSNAALILVFITGFATFALEVTWFRTLRAAFQNTSESFAIMLASVLVPLALGARLAPWARQRGFRLSTILCLSAIAILLATPVMERFDLIFLRFVGASAWDHVFAYFLATLLVLGPAVVTLGMSLPWLLEASDSPDRWGKLYGVNTLGAVAGSLLAAWLLLPSMGIARTAWLIGGLIAATSFMLSSSRGRVAVVAAGACALSIAILAESGVGRHRIQMQLPNELFKKGIIAFTEGRDSTVSVLEHRDGGAALVIDGFVASNEHAVSHYMDWMGYLPMVLHENPETALVICFGTGQTANAVRQENPKRLDIVELDRNVYSMANYFEKNENVLEDKRVNPIVMDGRAWLRRTRQSYDVITLEPMPPNFAGVNALYSQQFYELARERLNPGGIVAQWMPFHLISPHDAVAIAATFVSVFADSAIWLDPIGKTGILVGRQKTSEQPLIAKWPGLRTTNDKRGMTDDEIKESVALSGETLRRYISAGNSIITDDNQLLSYGPKRHRLKYNYDRIKALNLDLIRRAAQVKTRGVDPRPRGAARKPG